MLTSDLLVAWVRKGAVCPQWVDPASDEAQELAALVLAAIRRAAAARSPREDVLSEVDELVSAFSKQLKLVKGLAKLCLDRCEFEVEAALAPEDIREAVFLAAAEARKAGGFDREAVLASCAEALSAEQPAIEAGLYADLKGNERLSSFRDLEAEALLHRYNLALAQAVLFKAESLEVKVKESSPAGYRRLFGALKFHRLLHRVEGSLDEGMTVTIDGPMSIFSRSQQYGLRMASFLPQLVLAEDWSLVAQLQWGKRQTKLRPFSISHETGLRSHLHKSGMYLPEEIERLEADWPEDTDWEMSRDTEVLTLGDRGVLVPDFAFTHKRSGRKVLLDILGYWNRGSLARRLELLAEYGPDDLILAISKELCVDKQGAAKVDLSGLAAEPYLYRSFPVRRELLKRLEAYAPKARKSKKTPSGPRKARRKKPRKVRFK